MVVKKILFGISLIICGTIGISALLLVAVISASELGGMISRFVMDNEMRYNPSNYKEVSAWHYII